MMMLLGEKGRKRKNINKVVFQINSTTLRHWRKAPEGLNLVIVKICRSPSIPSLLLLGFNSAIRLLSAPSPAEFGGCRTSAFSRCRAKCLWVGQVSRIEVFLPAGLKHCSSSSASARHWEEGRSSLLAPTRAELASLGPRGAAECCSHRVTWEHSMLCCIWPCPKYMVANTYVHPICLTLQGIWRQGKPGFSHQKMRSKFNKDVECINLQKTPLRQEMPICSSKWAKTSPSTPFCSSGHKRLPNLSQAATKLHVSLRCALSFPVPAVVQTFHSSSAEGPRGCWALLLLFSSSLALKEHLTRGLDLAFWKYVQPQGCFSCIKCSVGVPAVWADLNFCEGWKCLFLSLSRRRGEVCLRSTFVLREIQELCPSPSPSHGQQASGNMNPLGTGGLYYVSVCHCISNGNE